MTRVMTRKSTDRERGATVVEFAVIVSLLLLILFGIMEFSFYFLQQHFVAGAAREGLRVGVRADNYNCFAPGADPKCIRSPYRQTAIIEALTANCGTGANEGYLCALYAADIAAGTVSVVIPQPVVDASVSPRRTTLSVTVTTPNFFPQLVSSLLPGALSPEQLSFTAVGNYEDGDKP